MRVYAYFAENPAKAYPIVAGSVFSDNLNEELDSAVITVTDVESADRLSLAPYDEVLIREAPEQTGGEVRLNRYYLMNSFREKMIDVANGVYEYEINLMSETKYLEKVQLPNRQFLHSNVGGYESQKTIAQAIDELMAVYVPRVKFTSDGETFSYEPLIAWHVGDGSEWDLAERFGQDLKDMSMSQPTLRQAITACMSQAGCIPTVVHRELRWLDLTEEPGDFGDASTINYVERTNASDGYATSLLTQGDNVLDQDNAVIDEVLCFRDRESVFLKQTENLYIETQFPIYRVDSLKLQASGTLTTEFLYSARVGEYIATASSGNVALRGGYYDGINAAVIVRFSPGRPLPDFELTDVEVGCARWVASLQRFIVESRIRIGAISSGDFSDMGLGNGDWIYTESAIGPAPTSDAFGYVSCNSDGTSASRKLVSYWDLDAQDWFSPSVTTAGLHQWDISGLCLTNEARAYLSRDYLNMSPTTFEELAQYIYGTVGYDVGGTRIEGFSETYTKINGFITSTTYTYLECIWDFLYSRGPLATLKGNVGLQSIYEVLDSGDVPSERTAFSFPNANVGNDYFFSQFSFDIRYSALNAPSVRFPKGEDEPWRITQLDTTSDAIASFGALYRNRTQTVRRIGRDGYQINQVTADWSDIKPLNVKYGDATVFKRVVSIGINDYDANYIGSEGYVIKDYSTSIQTKYRAYAYVDYSKSVDRRENTSYAIRFGAYHYDGTDSVSFPGSNKLLETLAPWLTAGGAYVQSRPIAYGLMQDPGNGNAFKEQLAIMQEGSLLTLTMRDLTNAHGAERFDPSFYSGDWTALGGIPQGWVAFSNECYDRRHVSAIANPTDYGETAAEIQETMQNSPLLADSDGNPIYDAADPSAGVPAISFGRVTRFKDWGEALSETFQFDYVGDEGIEIGGAALSLLGALGGGLPDGWSYKVVEGIELRDDEYELTDATYERSDAMTFGDGYARFDFRVDGIIRAGLKIIITDGESARDVMLVKREGLNRYRTVHAMVDDTCSTRVFSVDARTGLLTIEKYKVDPDTDARGVIEV